MAHRSTPMLHEPRPMAQGPMPERVKPCRSPSWPDDRLSISDGGEMSDDSRGDDDRCCKGDIRDSCCKAKGDIRDGNSVDCGIGDVGDNCVGEGSDGSDVCHSRYQR